MSNFATGKVLNVVILANYKPHQILRQHEIQVKPWCPPAKRKIRIMDGIIIRQETI